MNMISDWSRLTDANGDPYDPRPALQAIESNNADEGYEELWAKVHHQGNLGTAAYAAVPELVRAMYAASMPDWRAYALIATIDERRHAQSNPQLPDWLEESYRAAMNEVVQPAVEHLRAATEDLEVRSLIAVIAHAKGQRTIGAIALWTEDERCETLEEL